MADDEDIIKTETLDGSEAVDGVTIINEFSSGAGASGGSMPGGQVIGVVVDGATGEVVGTVTAGSGSGPAEASGIDVTVVQEESNPGSSSSSSSGGTATGDTTPPTGGGEESTPDSPLPDLDPTQFAFHDLAPGANSQETRCVPISFAYRISGVPATTPLSLPTRFTAPKKLADGTVITNKKAAALAYATAVEAKDVVKESIELGMINPATTEPLKKFRDLMEDMFKLQGNGFRFQTCFPPGGP